MRMAADPFEHFGEQEESVRLLDQHRDELVADARRVLAEAPGAQLVGCVFAPASAEAANFRAAMKQAAQPVSETAGMVLVMPRHMVVQLLRANVPAQLDWLESDAGKLPLLCATKSGVRLGWAVL